MKHQKGLGPSVLLVVRVRQREEELDSGVEKEMSQPQETFETTNHQAASIESNSEQT